MKLNRVKIKNFRSIVKMDLVIEDDITTLVGANECGKSNILDAISLLKGASFDIPNHKRIDSTAKKYCPSIQFFLKLNKEDRETIQENIQSKYPSTTIQNEDGTSSEGKPEKIIKFKDVPENIEYTLFMKEEDDKTYYSLNCSDEEMKGVVYKFLSDDFKNKIIYFDEFNDRLESVISKDEILKSKDNLLIQGLLNVCELHGKEEQIFTDDREILQLLDRAPQKITKAVKKAWYQGLKDDIKIKIIRDATTGGNLLIEIEDKNTFVDFKARSRGFKWFFSFFLKYRAYHDGDLKNSLFLIDEPGLFLHPKGQKDLLQYLERLGKVNQIIYSTHSPFMINRIKEKRVRVVEKKQKDGTTINTKGFTANWRHMRTSLGMVLSDSFYFADKTLLVEGPEDVIYILSLLQFFIKKENIDIDVNLLSIMDSGGASNLPPMAKIVKDEERPLVVLIDSDSQKILNKLKKYVTNKEMEEIKTFNVKAVTIQDLLPIKLYEQAVNKYIDKLLKDKTITLAKSTKKEYKSKAVSKIDKEVEEFVKEYYDDTISKVGIAREFEDLLNGKVDYRVSEFQNARNLIDWLIQTLSLKV